MPVNGKHSTNTSIEDSANQPVATKPVVTPRVVATKIPPVGKKQYDS